MVVQVTSQNSAFTTDLNLMTVLGHRERVWHREIKMPVKHVKIHVYSSSG